MKNVVEKYYSQVDIKEIPVSHGGVLEYLRSKLLFFEENRQETAIRNFVKSDKYLDIGSSSGSLLIALSGQYKFGYGVDISQKMVSVANKDIKRQKIKNITIKKANVEDGLAFNNETFDAVTALDVLEHLFDPIGALQEVYRVMKIGGLLYLSVPNIAWLPRRISLLMGKRPRTSFAFGWEGSHLQYFTFSELEVLLKSIGFKVVKRDCSGVFRELRSIYPPLLSANIFIVCKRIK